MIKIYAGLIVALTVVTTVQADRPHEVATGYLIHALSQADLQWRELQESEPSRENLKGLEIAFQKSAETIFAGTRLEVSEECRQALGILGNLIVDSAYHIFKDLEAKSYGAETIRKVDQKLTLLPNIVLGVVISLAGDPRPVEKLTAKERKSLIEFIEKEFGDKTGKNSTINEDTPFSRSASLMHGYLNAVEQVDE